MSLAWAADSGDGSAAPQAPAAPPAAGEPRPAKWWRGVSLGSPHVLRQQSPPPREPPSAEVDLDRLIHSLHRHGSDPSHVRHAADALRHTVEASLMQSARSDGGRLPFIIAQASGRAVLVFGESLVRRLAALARDWLVLLSSPRRMMWAVQAAWRGEDVAEHVRTKSEWHTVDEIAVIDRDSRACLVRAGREGAPADKAGALLSDIPLFGLASRLMLAQPRRADDDEAAALSDEMPVHTLVIVGEQCEVAARVAGHPPRTLRFELQRLCDHGDRILAERSASRQEQIARMRCIALPLLKSKEPVLARHFWHPVTMLAVILVIAVLMFGAAGLEHLRWSWAVAQLDAEPGIEVISHSSAWGRQEAEVLRDPLARPLAELILELDVNPAEARIRERPFLSADPDILAVRQQAQLAFARQIATETSESRELSKKFSEQSKAVLDEMKAIRPASAVSPAEVTGQVLAQVRIDMLRSLAELPADLKLELRDGVIFVRGDLAEPAWSRLIGSQSKLPWMKKLDLSAARDLTAANIAKLKSAIEKAAIEFIPASAILPETTKLRLKSTASDLALLAAELGLKKQAARIEMNVAHPLLDPAMAEQRAMAVRAELLRLDVPPAWFDASASAREAPGPNSLSFRIIIDSNPASP